MRKWAVVLVLLVCGLPLCAAPQKPAPKPPSTASQTKGSAPQALEPKQILQREAPGIVTVYAVDKNHKAFALGTGFIVRPNGVVVTNFHVVRGAYDAEIKLKSGEIYDNVLVLDYDERRDVVVLKIRALDQPVVTLGDSSTVEAGDRAYAIGNPEGYDYTISDGLISARRIMEGTEYLQITVPISHGSSGGPLYNIYGQVIGITAAGYMEGAQNLNFAVPIKYVLAMLDSPPRNMTLAQLFPAPAPSASAGPHQFIDPDGWLALTFPAGWEMEDPAPEGMMVAASKGQAATFLALRADAKNADDAFNNIRKAFSDKYGTLTKYSDKVNMDYKDGRHLRMQTFTTSSGGNTTLLFIAGLQHDRRVVALVGVFASEDSFNDLAQILKSLQF
jgi:S1-C subfamily serine protease